MGWVIRVFQSRKRSLMLTLMKSPIIPILDYCCQLWILWKAIDIQAIEAIQRTFTNKIIILIIIIRKGRQCKAGSERLTPYQPENHNPTTPTHRIREEKGKTVGDKKWASNKANKKVLTLLLKPASHTPSNTGSLRSFHRDTDQEIKFNIRRYWVVLQRGGA